MPTVRIVTTGALVAAVFGAAIASAAAQGTTQSAGRPLPLLQFIHKTSKTKPLAHPKVAAKVAAKVGRKKVAKRRIARRAIAKLPKAIARRKAVSAVPPKAVSATPRTPKVAAAAPLPDMWPAAGTVAPAMTGMLAPPQSTPPVSTEAVVETDPNQIISGNTVQVPSPDQINSVVPATDNHEQTASEETPKTAAPANPTPPEATATAIVARAVIENPDPVGSASWIEQVLAALGGALTAGVVAWFLIRPGSQQTYG